MYGIFKIGEFLEDVLLSLFAFHRISSSSRPFDIYPFVLRDLEIKKRVVNKAYLKQKIKYALKKLKKTGYIRIYKVDYDNIRVEFTKKALALIKIKGISENAQKYKKIKNGRRILFFDIPERKRRERDYFRNFLKLLGYKEVQKSVFVSEYDNYDDLISIANFLHIKYYIKTGIYYEDEIG